MQNPNLRAEYDAPLKAEANKVLVIQKQLEEKDSQLKLGQDQLNFFYGQARVELESANKQHTADLANINDYERRLSSAKTLIDESENTKSHYEQSVLAIRSELQDARKSCDDLKVQNSAHIRDALGAREKAEETKIELDRIIQLGVFVERNTLHQKRESSKCRCSYLWMSPAIRTLKLL